MCATSERVLVTEGIPALHWLWENIREKLTQGLTLREQKEGLPTREWFEIWKTSKESKQREIDILLDAVAGVLVESDAMKARAELRSLYAELKESHHQQAECRSREASAPTKASLSFVNRIFTKTKEGYDADITRESQRAADLEVEINHKRQAFHQALGQLGIDMSGVDIDFLTKPITKDDAVSFAAAAANIAAITGELERQVELSKESPQDAKRYYGMYVILLECVTRMHGQFVREIEKDHIPRVHAFAAEAGANVKDAELQIGRGGPANVLEPNIKTGRMTIQTCEAYVHVLEDQQRWSTGEKQKLRIMLDAAWNTFKTVRVSQNVVELIATCRSTFEGIKGLRLPEMRAYKNLRMKDEWERLTERLLEP